VNDDNGFGVPAGWYPDPLGLPQMRWWDNHGWTEHTTEARAPIVIQEAKLAWADDDPSVDDLPTRRERREREREDSSVDDGTNGSASPTAESLLELEPPSWDVLPADEPSPEPTIVPEFVELAPEPEVTPQPAAATPQPAEQPVTVPAAAQPVTVPAAAPQSAFAPESLFQPQPASAVPLATAPAATAPFAPGQAPSTNTAGAWIIALMPLVQLVLILLIVSAGGSTGASVQIILGILLAPYVVSIPLAIADMRALRAHGYERPASWAWAFLSGPIYLIARGIRILMRAANGFGPILVWGALVLLQVGSVVAVPGLVISALPQVFASEAAQSIEHDATVFGPITSVKCPAPPATVMGQKFDCTLTKIGSGQTYKVTASLQRENGWIAWRVDDWGTNTLSR
jgi:hypothetical protein